MRILQFTVVVAESQIRPRRRLRIAVPLGNIDCEEADLSMEPLGD